MKNIISDLVKNISGLNADIFRFTDAYGNTYNYGHFTIITPLYSQTFYVNQWYGYGDIESILGDILGLDMYKLRDLKHDKKLNVKSQFTLLRECKRLIKYCEEMDFIEIKK